MSGGELMRIIGLTGGIASGKSTVSAMLRQMGAQVIDADEIARQVVEPGSPALAEISRRFPGVIGPDGRLDRAQLADRIFANPADRAALNAIVHPRVHRAFLEKTRALAEAGTEAVIYDAALLIENELHRQMDGVILVTATPEIQVARLTARNHLSRDQAQARLASQMPISQKAPFARWIIDNSGDLANTRAQAVKVWNEIQATAGRKSVP